MRLLELDPQFCLWQDRVVSTPGLKPAGGEYGSPSLRTLLDHFPGITLGEAQGLLFTCPACRNHMLQVGFEGRGLEPHQASQSRNGGPSRWTVAPSSTGYADLTLTPSIDSGCWHGFITNGEAI